MLGFTSVSERRSPLLKGLVALAIFSLVFSLFSAFVRPVIASHDSNALHVQQDVPIDADEYKQGSESDCADLALGDARFHFIANNAPDGAVSAELTATFDGAATQTLTEDVGSGAIHFTVDSSSDILTDAWVIFLDASGDPIAPATEPPASNLVLSHTCASVDVGSLLVLKTDEGGGPLEGATFEVTDSQDAVVGGGDSDADGLFCVDGLVPGEYTVTETVPPGGHNLDPNNPQNFTVVEGADCATRIAAADDPDLTFVNALIVGSLLVLKTDGTDPLPGATFEVTDSQDAVVGGGDSDADGLFCVDGLVPGEYTVTETAQPGGYDPDPNNPQTFTVVESDDCTTRIDAADDPDLTFVNALIPLGSITVVKEIPCDVCDTFTPGAFFNEGENNELNTWANDSLTNDPIEVAGETFDSVQDVQDNSDPGSLLRHYLALVLNLRLATENDCDLGSSVYTGEIEALQGMTVDEILAEAETVLNSGASDFTEEQLHDAIDEINNNHGAEDGVLACDEDGTGTSGFTFTLTDSEDNVVEGETGEDGTLTFSDLPLGTYTLVETGGPAGTDCTVVSASGGEGDEDQVVFDPQTGTITITLTEDNADVTVTVVNECDEDEDGGGTLEIDKFFCSTDGESGVDFIVLGPVGEEPLGATQDAGEDLEGCELGAGVAFTIENNETGEITNVVTDENGIVEVTLDPGDYTITEDMSGESTTFTIADGQTTAVVVINLIGDEDGVIKVIKLFCEADEDSVTFTIEGGDQLPPSLDNCEAGEATFTLNDGDEFTVDGIRLIPVSVGSYVLAEVDPNTGTSESFDVTAGETTTVIVVNNESAGGGGGGGGEGEVDAGGGTSGGDEDVADTALDASTGSIPAVIWALVLLAALGGLGTWSRAEARRRR